MAKKKENFIGMSEGELGKKLATLREDLRAIHFKAEGAKSKNVKEASALKKNIARVLTQINSHDNKK
jgi:ribosomal protein L29